MDMQLIGDGVFADAPRQPTAPSGNSATLRAAFVKKNHVL
jgi:hypothetical protein